MHLLHTLLAGHIMDMSLDMTQILLATFSIVMRGWLTSDINDDKAPWQDLAQACRSSQNSLDDKESDDNILRLIDTNSSVDRL